MVGAPRLRATGAHRGGEFLTCTRQEVIEFFTQLRKISPKQVGRYFSMRVGVL